MPRRLLLIAHGRDIAFSNWIVSSAFFVETSNFKLRMCQGLAVMDQKNFFLNLEVLKYLTRIFLFLSTQYFTAKNILIW